MSTPIRGKSAALLKAAARNRAASSLEGSLRVGRARGRHLPDRSSNRRASWETPNPGGQQGVHAICEQSDRF